MNNHNNYPWQRYWCPRSGSIDLSDDGFLLKPSDESSWYRKFDYTTFENLTGFDCLVLLGEPGLGKSYCLKTEFGKEKTLTPDSHFIFHNLNEFSSDSDLYRELFHNADYINSIAHNKIVLYLDSLDESLIQIKTVAKIITRELRKLSSKQLSLRIACRSAEWPHYFENDLIELFTAERLGVYELVPLTKEDVKIVLQNNNISENSFFNDVREKELSSFAAKPVTLFFLVNLFKKYGSLPHSKTELFKQGIKHLCQEQNDFRKTLTLQPAISNDFIYSVAERIAAITIFSNFSNIFIGQNTEIQSDSDITISELEGGFEVVNGIQIPVTDNVIKQVLNTGLFSLRGNYTIGWAHQTFAEFLAASYLVTHHFVSDQVISIISQVVGEYRNIIPQFYEVAGWLSSLKKEYFSEIFDISPETLLKSDLSLLDENYKKLLVEKILEKYNRKELYDNDRKRFLYYRNLKHSNLADQIREYILDKNKYYLSRNIAIDIIKECKIVELTQELQNVIYDKNELYEIRRNALHTYVKIVKSEDLVHLKSLLGSEINLDDDFKGIILNHLWPKYLTAQELFSNLKPPKRLLLGGPYWLFIDKNPIDQLQIVDLPLALKWATALSPRRPLKDNFDKMIDSLIWLGWKFLGNPEVLNAFSELLLKKAEHFEEILSKNNIGEFQKEIESNQNNRRVLLKRIIELTPNPEKNYYLVIIKLRLVFPEDLLWLLAEYDSYPPKNNHNIKKAFARIFLRYMITMMQH